VPKIKSAKKRLRKSREQRLRNQAVKSQVKTAVRAARAVIDTGAEHAQASVRDAHRIIDKAAAKGVLHPNSAARRKSRLARRAHKASA
jgi:small subunit ribosomal protein S20